MRKNKRQLYGGNAGLLGKAEHQKHPDSYRKMERCSLKELSVGAAVFTGIFGILFLSGCSQYDVLNKVSDNVTTGANTTERVQDYIEEHTSTEKSVLTQLVSKMTDGNTDSNDDVNARPEYDPLQYVDVSKAEITKIKQSSESAVTDADVDDSIKQSMVNKGIYNDNETAEKGDIVNINYTATESGKETPFVDVTDEDRTIGDNLFPDEIDSKLVGVKSGDEIDVTYTYPDDYNNDSYRGKTFMYHIVINEVKGMSLTDEVASRLAYSNGRQTTASEYKEYIRHLLEYKELEILSESGVDELCNMCVVKDYPEDVVNYDIQCEFIRLYKEFDIDGSDKEALAKKIESLGYKSLEDFTSEINKNVMENLKKEMEVLALAKKYGLWLSDDELATEILNQTTGYSSADDYYEAYSKYHAQYVVARINIAKEIQKKWKID